jgi:hypothetical protein
VVNRPRKRKSGARSFLLLVISLFIAIINFGIALPWYSNYGWSCLASYNESCAFHKVSSCTGQYFHSHDLTYHRSWVHHYRNNASASWNIQSSCRLLFRS